MRVDLGEGQWAELKELNQLTRGDKKAVLRATTMELDPSEGKAYISGANDEDQADALMRRIVVEWSFPMPLPSSDPKVLDRLSLEQGDRLQEAVKPYLELINTKVDPAKKGTDPTAG
jgi:hypothetical protein